MSQWTHVAAVFRVDCIRQFGQISASAVQRVFKNRLPYGSEGPLEVTVWENPNKHHLAAFTVTIFGDLRDYNDAEDIKQYLNEKAAQISAGAPIRQAVATIHVEGKQPEVWQHENDSP